MCRKNDRKLHALRVRSDRRWRPWALKSGIVMLVDEQISPHEIETDDKKASHFH